MAALSRTTDLPSEINLLHVTNQLSNPGILAQNASKPNPIRLHPRAR